MNLNRSPKVTDWSLPTFVQSAGLYYTDGTSKMPTQGAIRRSLSRSNWPHEWETASALKSPLIEPESNISLRRTYRNDPNEQLKSTSHINLPHFQTATFTRRLHVSQTTHRGAKHPSGQGPLWYSASHQREKFALFS